MILLNHSPIRFNNLDETAIRYLINKPDSLTGLKLYRNDNGVFKEVTQLSGIKNSRLNFNLGVSVADINNDGLPDLYISNDYFAPDYLYINKGNGTFKDELGDMLSVTSEFSMGNDIADINNDGLPDIYTLDMLPEDNHRQKLLFSSDNFELFDMTCKAGLNAQYMRNMLHVNNGNGSFSEIGQLAGVSNTDWSWAALFADLDNDGWKDLFVTNGYLRDYTNLDFIKYDVDGAFDEAAKQGNVVKTKEDYQKYLPLYELVKKMPSTKLSNYVFQNKKDLTFANETSEWGLGKEGVSSGAAYADLDNDGDLDLVVCNNNDPVWLFKNNANLLGKNNFISIRLKGDRKNVFAIGAKVIVSSASGSQLQEMYPVRGYQSSVDYSLHFGLGADKKINEIKVIWPNDSVTIALDPVINKTMIITMENLSENLKPAIIPSPLFVDVSRTSGIDFIHKENPYVDFKYEFLAPYQLSRQGPKMSKADVNGDGLEDFFIGGPAGESGCLYLQVKDGQFKRSPSQPWVQEAICEDVGSLFFDADNDGDADLYVVSGGNERGDTRHDLQDRLYINDSKGNFSRFSEALPEENFSGSCIAATDFDGDGDMDLFVGSRGKPGNYPYSAGNILLRNDLDKTNHILHFTNVTLPMTDKALFSVGMVTDAVWNDIDKDGWPDLVITGDWMNIKIFHNEKGRRFSDITASSGLDSSAGWWCKIIPADIDNDGDIDFIAGNMGTNTQFKAKKSEPLITYAGDFNGDGRTDPILTWYIQGSSYPFNSRDELIEQMPALNKKFLKYADYAKADIHGILSDEQIEKADKFYIYNTQTSVLVNNHGRFDIKPLQQETQFSMMSGILYDDYDGDGLPDILLSGNFYPFRVQQGRCDANLGVLLKGDGKGNFNAVARALTGLYIPGDVRDMIAVKGRQATTIIISKNSDTIQALIKVKGKR